MKIFVIPVRRRIFAPEIIWGEYDTEAYEKISKAHNLATRGMFDGDTVKAYEWLFSPNTQLDNQTPIHEIHSGRGDRVIQLLEAILI